MPDINSWPRLLLEGDDLVYRDGDFAEIWRVPITSMTLIGEHTTSAGPSDDWFLEIGYNEGGLKLLREISMPGGAENVLAELGSRLGSPPIQLQLVQSTSFDSRVLWPEKLAGKPLFTKRLVARSGKLGFLLTKLFGRKAVWFVSDEVLRR